MLKIATYNILHGHYSSLILENLKLLIKKEVKIICIQEADRPFKDLLTNFFKNHKWEIIYFHKTRGCNLAIAWNPIHLNLKNTEQISLPLLSKPSFIQRLTLKNEKLHRGALSASFIFNNKSIQITNTHLSWEGGMKQTLLQLSNLRDILAQKEEDYAVLIGDFNTFTLAPFRNFKRKKIEKVLKNNWANAFPNSTWSCDISYWVPYDGYKLLAQILNKLHIKMRSLLDYIFVKKNIYIVSTEMLDLPGSDHRPLIIELDLNK